MRLQSGNILNSVKIKNYKSIGEVELSDCRRINVFIGRPNVGKSNFIEAMALFDVPFLINSSSRSLKSLVRMNNSAEIFNNGNTSRTIEIIADSNIITVDRNNTNGISLDLTSEGSTSKYVFNSSLNLTSKKEPSELPGILTYLFPKEFVAETSNIDYLSPPFGANLMDTVAKLSGLKSDLSELFHRYGLRMMFDSGSQQITAVRENGLDMFIIPFSSLADSLQRLIFYRSAIKSNHNKVLCFEEPESHTFPPYISLVVNDILSARDNQFFITTHSPYVISSLLEDAGKELAIYIVNLKNNETIVERLTDNQLQKVYDCGIDLFYNMETFISK